MRAVAHAAAVDRALATAGLAFFAMGSAIWTLAQGGYSPDAAPEQGGLLLRVIAAALYLAVVIRLFPLRRRVVQQLRRRPALTALVGLAMLSAAWSVDPGLTLRRGIALAGTTLFGLFLIVRFSIRDQLRLVGGVLAALLVASLMLVLSRPELAISEAYEGAWRGLMSNRNELARWSVLAAMVFGLLGASGSGPRRKLWWTGVALAVAILLQTGSATGPVVLLGTAGVLLPATVARGRALLIVAAAFLGLVVVSLAGLWLQTHLHEALTLVDRTGSLSGRTWIWARAVEFGAERPLLGYGYGAAWSAAAAGAPGAVLPDLVHSHNGFLDLWLDLGAVGMAAFGVVVCFAVAGAVRLLRSRRSVLAVWPLGYVAFHLFYNLTESALVQQNSLFWMLFVGAVVACDSPADLANPAETPERRPRRLGSRVGS